MELTIDERATAAIEDLRVMACWLKQRAEEKPTTKYTCIRWAESAAISAAIIEALQQAGLKMDNPSTFKSPSKDLHGGGKP